LNLQEIKGIKFGTTNPVNYFDTFYNAELFIRAHGTYSIKIVNPLQFYAEAIPKNKDHVEITEINEQYLSEFMEALQAAINQMSADGERISFVMSKARELGKYMANVLDEDWNKMRGMEIQAVGIKSLSYDETSKELINTRNEGAMLSDPGVAQGYMVKNLSEGVKNAGSNSAGAMTGFMGVGMGINAMGNMMGGFSQMNQNAQAQPGQGQQAPAPQPQTAGAVAAGAMAGGWTCECGTTNTGKFCSNCGKPAPAGEWTCECGTTNSGKFCSNCGKPRP
jgi:membrane protease subunit (stomatin/prohibitin family)